MDKIVIQGGKRLNGAVRISGAKNAALPAMAASILTTEELELFQPPGRQGCGLHPAAPRLHGGLGRKGENRQACCHTLRKARQPRGTLRPGAQDAGVQPRSGARSGPLRGGDGLPPRRVRDRCKAHQPSSEGFGADGGEVWIEHGNVRAKAKRLKGAKIVFDTVTVTGTENIMMAATLATGTTVLENSACEPEVMDLADLLRKMGARISGDGTERIAIEGVTELHGATHTIIPTGSRRGPSWPPQR